MTWPLYLKIPNTELWPQFSPAKRKPVVTETHLPPAAAARKAIPIATGVVDYFPDALMDVAALSKVGNDQHNPGQPLQWSREKSNDHPDCLMRHFVDRGTLDSDGIRHSAKVAWRALAILQLEIEAARLEALSGPAGRSEHWIKPRAPEVSDENRGIKPRD